MKMEWKYYFPTEILKRGQSYYTQNRVDDFKVKGNYCSAIVYGSEAYHVIIKNPGKNNMVMTCDCPHAMDGYSCKHMAAVLFQWQDYKNGAVLNSRYADNPFVNADKHRPFFDFEEITSELCFRESTIDAARQMISDGTVELTDFSCAYNTSYVGRCDDVYIAIITGTYTDGLGVHDMRIFANKGKVERYDCGTCGDYYYGWYYGGMKNPCSHITALLLLADEYSRKYDPGDYTDYNAVLFFNAFGKETLKNFNDRNGNIEGTIRLEPRLIETGTGLELNFKIGNGGKMYIVKNLTELHDNYYERKIMKLGKENAIDFATETFEEGSAQLFDIIEREVKRSRAIEQKMINKRSYQYYGTLEAGKGLPFVGDTADAIYENLLGKTIECKFLNERRNFKLMVGEKDPVINLYMDPEYDKLSANREMTGINIHGEMPLIVEGVKNHYFITENDFSILNEQLQSKILPFTASGEGKGGEFEFFIGRKRMAEFYYNILGALLENPVFNVIENGNIAAQIKEKAEFVFYMDVEDGQILCKSKVTYGEETFVLKSLEEEALPLHEKRDMGQEAPVRRVVQEMFEDFSPTKEAFILHDAADVRYGFLKHGINRLLNYGDVQATERFSRMKIRRLPVVQMGIKMENNLLDLTVQNQDLTSEDLAALLDSYRQKKKYHRLRNDEYVDLEKNESVEALMLLLETTGASVKDFVKGKLRIPAYRALYIEKMLENHEELVANRDRTYRNLIRNFKTIEEGDWDVPNSLQNVLRPYQTYGFKWLKTLETAGFGGILADDMGLGKTLQIISLILSNKEANPESKNHAIVLCPASLVYNWIEEIELFAPELKAIAITGSKKQRTEIIKAYEQYDVLVTSYDLLKRDIDMYEDLQFSHQIIDEAQYIKNAGSAAAKSVKLIKAVNRFALTGTPIENRLSELWSIFDYLMPGFLNGYDKFRKNFELPISKNKDQRQTEILKNMISPFILRRKKADVLKDLPDKIEEKCFARFEGEQQVLYDAQVDKIRRFIESEEKDLDKSRIQILAELTKIRQICCDPRLIFENYSGGSAKMEACIELIKSAIDGEHKILLFSQFTSMLKIIEERLKNTGIDYYKLTGETSKEERMRLVKAFNSDDVPIFLISLKAGGTGLNLTGADIVIHFDPWWNRAAQDQATDRAHRIGQTKNVTVYQLIAKDSIEEKIVKLQNEKKELADAILTGESKSIGTMSKEELLELLDL